MKKHEPVMTTFKPLFIAYPIILFALVLSGCQTKDVQPLSVAQINTYAKPVLERSINNIALFNACKTLGSPILEEATTQYEAWLKTNGKLAQAADNFTSRHQTDYVKYQNTYYSLGTIMEVDTIVRKVLNTLNFKQRGPSSQKNICRREFGKISQNPLSQLRPSSDIGNALLAQANTEVDHKYASVLDTAKADIVANQPGKSYYKVSGDLSKLCENKLSLLTLKNTWPKETYAAYCQNSAFALIQCNWGSCKQHEPMPYQP